VKIRIGSRGSALALWQARHVEGQLRAIGHEVEIRAIVTTGDRLQDRRLDIVGGKGAFLKEIEEAMLRGEIDLAVHSLKDVPTALPEGLALGATLPRADPRDALLSVGGTRLRALPQGARVGTTSLRRRCQLKALRPDLAVEDLRGNVDTRIRRLEQGDYDAIVLAMAGLLRLGRRDEVAEVLEPDVMLPAPGQGAIVLECRQDDTDTFDAVAFLHDVDTASAVAAERAFLGALGGGCNVPLGAHASWADRETLWLRGLVADAGGGIVIRAEARGRDPLALGEGVARDLIARGADGLIGR
jgi:hydroxymethylbilane synthase